MTNKTSNRIRLSRNFSLSEIQDLNKLTPLSAAGQILARNGFKLPKIGDEWFGGMIAETEYHFANGSSAIQAAILAIESTHPAFA
jgi:hypothetical protein